MPPLYHVSGTTHLLRGTKAALIYLRTEPDAVQQLLGHTKLEGGDRRHPGYCWVDRSVSGWTGSRPSVARCARRR